MAVIGVFNDRLCIKTGGKFNKLLSPGYAVACCTPDKGCEPPTGCSGATTTEIWDFAQRFGIPTGGEYRPRSSMEEADGCFPYNFPPCDHTFVGGKYPACSKVVAETPSCPKTCRNRKYRTKLSKDRHFVAAPGEIDVREDVDEIKREIFVNGSLEDMNLLLLYITLSVLPTKAAIQRVRTIAGLNCEGEGEYLTLWPIFRRTLYTHGADDQRTVLTAVQVWEAICLALVDEDVCQSLGSEENHIMPEAIRNMFLNQLRILKPFATTGEFPKEPLTDFTCMYGTLTTFWVMMLGAEKGYLPMDHGHRIARFTLAVLSEIVFDGGDWSLDFMDSASDWNISTGLIIDQAARFINQHFDGPAPTTIEEWLEQTTPPDYNPRNRPWEVDYPVNLCSRGTPERKVQEDEHRRRERLSGTPPQLAILERHDGTALDIGASAKAAIATEWAVPVPDVVTKYYWVKTVNYNGTSTYDEISRNLVSDHEWIDDWFPTIKAGNVTYSQFIEEGIRPFYEGNDYLSDPKTMIVCGEEFFVCLGLWHVSNRPMILFTNMSILLLFLFKQQGDFDLFWELFYKALRHPSVRMAVMCRITQEQILRQTGIRVPYVPFTALHITESHTMARGDAAMFFRNNLFHLRNFHQVFHSLLRRNYELGYPVRVFDMNDYDTPLEMRDLVDFRAVIMLAYIPNALRLTDMYAARVPIFTPDVLVSGLRHVWINKPYTGWYADPRWTSQAPGTIREEVGLSHRDETLSGCSGPEMDIFLHTGPAALVPFIGVNQTRGRRYWWQATEWYRTPGIQWFRNMGDLMNKLETLNLTEVHLIIKSGDFF
ncbi:hypothetical protein FOL47_002534 [Perkinsus chesapeaki]|uniref:Peptidase C1A papain C-terminal domain-containing protein n=1 Tax=Perkinsus chesapeaki TaxID=330153 RepID=A0A7J6ME77_PERCH|nr:hypothetical protein FOL47_002534 [Perkinsus chesapeaki]